MAEEIRREFQSPPSAAPADEITFGFGVAQVFYAIAQSVRLITPRLRKAYLNHELLIGFFAFGGIVGLFGEDGPVRYSMSHHLARYIAAFLGLALLGWRIHRRVRRESA
jgi:hypothetical protein